MNLRTRVLIVGGIIGAALGVAGGLLYWNSNLTVDAKGEEQLEMPTPSSALQLGLGVITVLRQITK